MSVLDSVKRSLFGPKTIQVAHMSNPCFQCGMEGGIAEIYLDSDDAPELMVWKCPKCGPIKTLYAGRRPEPRFEKNYWTALTGDFNKKKLTPKREI